MRHRFLPGLSSGLLRKLLAIAAALALAACSSSPSKTPSLPPTNPFKAQDNGPGSPKSRISEAEAKLKAGELYRVARKQMQNAEFNSAIKSFDDLISRFPFTEYAVQAEVDKIYAQYRNYQFDDALAGADRFLREHPRHPDASYVQYLKGLADSAQGDSLLRYLPLSSAQRDIGSKERAFSDFALLIQRYPDSMYAADARQRMIALRNEIADHELEIGKFYLRRGAYLAAARRAEEVIARFPGAPATAKALELLRECYAKLGLRDQEQQVQTLIAANRRSFLAVNAPAAASTAPNADGQPLVLADSGGRARDCGVLQRLWYFVTFRSCREDAGNRSGLR